MLGKVFKFFKRVLFYIFLLYSFNLVVAPIGLNIPINYFTVLSLSILGVPALFGFILILVLMF